MNNYKEKQLEKSAEHYAKKVFKVIAAIVFGAIVFGLAIYVLMRLWNWLTPELWGWSTLTYWQALGLFVLAKIIFGFGGEGACKPKKGKKNKKKWKMKCDMRNDFSDWKLYDEFWTVEGEAAFKRYIENHKKRHHENEQKQS
ncbi:hypothetical protein [Flavobacterium sp. ASW18X]|uniref:hypothetical protein n=1 Tax=Flavobacterium sp. ASW18X TaxID=2572595 RepID=UPI0010AE6BD3|nr:hypothetical protein [Flavobacterium sp. ASW18X]TKD67297.1 hypothetical protein FBT53_00385 [Flavobacterium sp. ASW18X]